MKNDLVSRSCLLNDFYYLAEKIGIHRVNALVDELCRKQESCEDVVSKDYLLVASRKSAEDYLKTLPTANQWNEFRQKQNPETGG